MTLTSDGAAATAQVSGSPYAIVASNATGSGLANYTIRYANGSLTVAPALLTVTANNTTMILGGPVPTFSAYYIGFVNGDSVSDLGNLGSLTFTPVNATVQGTTAIMLNGSLTSSNYRIVYDPGTLTVTASKPIIIGLPLSQKSTTLVVDNNPADQARTPPSRRRSTRRTQGTPSPSPRASTPSR